MEISKRSRDLEQIVRVFRERGKTAVKDGDAVAVLVSRRHIADDGVPHVHFDVHRVRTLTEAYVATF